MPLGIAQPVDSYCSRESRCGERRVAEALYAGSTLQRYAEERGISIHTVRNQLKSLMAKVGVARQSHLVTLFASLLSGAR